MTDTVGTKSKKKKRERASFLIKTIDELPTQHPNAVQHFVTEQNIDLLNDVNKRRNPYRSVRTLM